MRTLSYSEFGVCPTLEGLCRTSMPKHKRILSVAYIESLGASRKALLEAAGYDVQAVKDLSEALLHLKKSKFDLVIVGHAVPRTEDQAIVDAAEHAGDTPTLLLYESGPGSQKKHFNVEDGADELLRMVAQLCGEKEEKR
jgi:DNA-binding response OmpR family regulator